MCSICFGEQEGVGIENPSFDAHPSGVDTSVEVEGQTFLRSHPTVDMHAHPGRFFLEGEQSGTALAAQLGTPFMTQAINDIRAGGVTAILFATVADHLLLEQTENGLRAVRDFKPGEAYDDHLRQIRAFRELAAESGLRIGDNIQSVNTAHRDREPLAFLSIEGGDFIEDKLERIQEAHRAGVRTITVVHYRANQIGDTQTEDAVHGGLTGLGKAIIAELEATGIIVDLSHASFATCAAIARVATRPALLSHSNLKQPGQRHPRLIGLELARMVTDSGGLIGAVPAGFDQFSFDDYVDTICYMIDSLGIDHVGIGTDMDYTYRPVLDNYRQWPRLAGSLLRKGLHADELAKVMGGNMLRMLAGAGV